MMVTDCLIGSASAAANRRRMSRNIEAFGIVLSLLSSGTVC